MLIAILQVLLTIAACFGLWRFLRALDGRGAASRVIGAGFIIRALGSQILFWISWLRLPFGRSLQIGDGLWFFAIDGRWYLGYTRELLARGVKAILFINANYPSRIFTQWLTVFTAAFGAVASTAILLNCAAYLATCALILRIGPARAERERTFALLAVALGPAAILWSLQPLKDTFFVLLLVLMVALCDAWQKLWRGASAGTWRWILLCAAAMCAIVYAIAGTRWYVGATLAGGSLVFLALVANLPRPRIGASIVAVLLFLMLGQAFRLGGDLDIPDLVRKVIDPATVLRARLDTTRTFLASTRRGFETTPGATSIAPGAALLQPAPVASGTARTDTAKPSVAESRPHEARTGSNTGTSPAANHPQLVDVRTTNPEDFPSTKPTGPAAAQKLTSEVPPAAREPQKPASAAALAPAPARTVTQVPVATTTTVAPSASSKVAAEAVPAAPHIVPSTTATAANAAAGASAFKPAPSSVVTTQAKPSIAPESSPAIDTTPVATSSSSVSDLPVRTPAQPASTSHEPAADARSSSTGSRTPRATAPSSAASPPITTTQPPAAATNAPAATTTHAVSADATQPSAAAPAPQPSPRLAAKIVSGVVATFVPRFVAQPLGLVRIGGGRGFWLFADSDTLVFDLVIFVALGYCARSIVQRKRSATPLFVLVALVFVALAAPMMYSVTNFGTLFRLRQMIYVLAALLPLTLDLRETAD